MAELNELYKKANTARELGNKEEAIELYEQVVALYPDTIEAKYANSIALNLQKPVSPYEKYQTVGNRIIAAVIDGLVFLPVGSVIFYLTVTTGDPLMHMRLAPIETILFFAYSILMHGRYGQTLGKMAAKVKVLDVSESKLSYKQAFLRDSIPFILAIASYLVFLPMAINFSSPDQAVEAFQENRLLVISSNILNMIAIVWWVTEIITMLTNKKRRAIHDYIAGSVVIKND